MKILVLSSHAPSLFWFRLDMMISFQKIGYELVVASPEKLEEWVDKFAQLNIKYCQISVSRNGMNPFNDIQTLISLNRLLKRERPDKIFVYQAKTIAYGCIAAKMNGITEVYPMVAGLGSIFRGKGLKNKLVKIVMMFLYKYAFTCSKKIFFQNGDDKNEMLQYGLLDEAKTAMLNGSGVNLRKFEVVSLPESPAFLYIGRLIRDKGIMEYLNACVIVKKQYPLVRCLLVGPYDSNPSALKPEDLQPYIDGGIVEYFGEQTDVRPYIAQCTTLVLPSYHEGTPKTVLESMSMGRSILTSDAPGCRETVVNGKNGFLIPVKNISALVDKMIYLISYPEVSVKMGEYGRQMAEDKYDVNKVNRKIAEIMELI